ncbi:MAG TPA: exo-alpha-sialidase, partial [Pirellulaceae bacterium]|nr:exo-alpha-sialidase [Pirellulaceae bacterium]
LVEGRNYFWLSCRLKPTSDLQHRVSATCVAIETTVGTVIPANDFDNASQRIGVALRRHNDDGVHTYRIPALTTSTKGSLLAVYDMRRRAGRDLQEDIDIGLSRSTDGGRTWEAPRVIMDMGLFGGLPQEQNGCSDPGIIVDRQTGEIFVFAVWMNGKPGKHQWVDDGSEDGFEIGKAAQLMLVRSRDDGLTWSPPENLTRKLKQESWWLLAPAPQSGFCLADGTLVMPVQGRTGRDKLATFATIMISRDHGQTWTVANHGFTGGNECQAAPLGDGSIMLNVRNDRERFRAVSVTKDLGQTWQPHATSGNTLIEPNCNGSLLRVDYERNGEKHHVLLFANPHSQKGRTHHTVQVSFDDGATWPDSHHWLLDEGRGAGYPSLTRIDHDHIGIVYEGSQSHLTFESLKLEDLLEPTRRHATREIWQRAVSPEGAS